MIVGPRQSHIAQGGCLEAVAVTLYTRLCPTSVVGIGQARLHIDFTVFEVVGTLSHHLVREAAHIDTGMARSTLVLLEEGISLYLSGRHSLLVTFQVAVKGRIRRDECLLILGNGIGNGLFAQSFGISRTETLREVGIGCESLYNFVKRCRTHLYRIEGRSCCLCGQGSGTSVPELDEVEHGVVRCRCIDTSQLPAYTVGILVIVHTGRCNVMAGGARYGAVARQARVVIEFLTQLHLVCVH